VKVDDIDPNGKISLSPVGELAGGGDSPKASDGGDVVDSDSRTSGSSSTTRELNFGDTFDAELREEFGDLGPAATRGGGGGGGRGGDRGGRGGRSGGGGGRGGQRRR